jgi:hypothetical protein
MERIITEYRGHQIEYSHNADEWNCFDVGYSSSKLSNVRSRIDKFYLDIRKNSAISCFELEHNGHGKTPAMIIDFIKQKQDRSWDGKLKEIDHIVSVVAKRAGKQKQSRREAKITELMQDTPEAEAAYQVYVEKYHLYLKAQREYHAAKQAIPRVKPEQIETLIKIKLNEDSNENGTASVS